MVFAVRPSSNIAPAVTLHEKKRYIILHSAIPVRHANNFLHGILFCEIGALGAVVRAYSLVDIVGQPDVPPVSAELCHVKHSDWRSRFHRLHALGRKISVVLKHRACTVSICVADKSCHFNIDVVECA